MGCRSLLSDGASLLLLSGDASLLPLATAALLRLRLPLLRCLLLLLLVLLSSPAAPAVFETPLRLRPASWMPDTVLAAYSGSCHSRLASADRWALYSSSSSCDMRCAVRGWCVQAQYAGGVCRHSTRVACAGADADAAAWVWSMRCQYVAAIMQESVVIRSNCNSQLQPGAGRCVWLRWACQANRDGAGAAASTRTGVMQDLPPPPPRGPCASAASSPHAELPWLLAGVVISEPAGSATVRKLSQPGNAWVSAGVSRLPGT